MNEYRQLAERLRKIEEAGIDTPADLANKIDQATASIAPLAKLPSENEGMIKKITAWFSTLPPEEQVQVILSGAGQVPSAKAKIQTLIKP